jgi:hypothetical protein
MEKKTDTTPAAAAAAGDTTQEVKTVIADTAIETETLQAKVTELEGDPSAANAEVARLTALIDENEGLLAEAQVQVLELKNLAAKTPDKAPAVDGEPKSYFEYQGMRYAFTDKTPKRLCVDDKLFTQEELYNDEDAIISLIVGESAFLKQVF